MKVFNKIQDFYVDRTESIAFRHTDQNTIEIRNFNAFDLELQIKIESELASKIFISGKTFLYTIAHPINGDLIFLTKSYNQDNLQIERYSIPGSVAFINNMNLGLIYSSKNGGPYYKCFEIGNGEFLWSVPAAQFSCAFFDDLYYCWIDRSNRSVFGLMEVKSGQQLWTIDLEQNNLINEKLVHQGWDYSNNLLFVPLISGKVVFVDISTGEIVDILRSPYEYGLFDFFLLDKINYKLIKIINKTYHEIDIKTKEINFQIITNSLQNNLPIGKSMAHNDTNIFTFNDSQTKIYAVNKKTLETTWNYNLEIDPNTSNGRHMFIYMKSIENKLFVGDTKFDLRIFQFS